MLLIDRFKTDDYLLLKALIIALASFAPSDAGLLSNSECYLCFMYFFNLT